MQQIEQRFSSKKLSLINIVVPAFVMTRAPAFLEATER